MREADVVLGYGGAARFGLRGRLWVQLAASGRVVGAGGKGHARLDIAREDNGTDFRSDLG